MQVKAVAKYIKVQPRKVRIIADQVRNTSAPHTVSLLRYHTSKSARELRKVLMSAMANAQENHGVAPEQLRIASIQVDEGPRLKRMQARAMGRGNRIVKKTSHITVVVEEQAAEVKVKPHGTKAKPRPTFAAPAKKVKGKAKAEPATEVVAEAPVVEETAVEEPIVEATPEVTEAPVVEEAVPAESTETEASADAEGDK